MARRTGARQLAGEDEVPALLGAMEDVKGFLGRKDGALPPYVKRKDLVDELMKVGADTKRDERFEQGFSDPCLN